MIRIGVRKPSPLPRTGLLVIAAFATLTKAVVVVFAISKDVFIPLPNADVVVVVVVFAISKDVFIPLPNADVVVVITTYNQRSCMYIPYTQQKLHEITLS